MKPESHNSLPRGKPRIKVKRPRADQHQRADNPCGLLAACHFRAVRLMVRRRQMRRRPAPINFDRRWRLVAQMVRGLLLAHIPRPRIRKTRVSDHHIFGNQAARGSPHEQTSWQRTNPFDVRRLNAWVQPLKADVMRHPCHHCAYRCARFLLFRTLPDWQHHVQRSRVNVQSTGSPGWQKGLGSSVGS